LQAQALTWTAVYEDLVIWVLTWHQHLIDISTITPKVDNQVLARAPSNAHHLIATADFSNDYHHLLVEVFKLDLPQRLETSSRDATASNRREILVIPGK